MMKNLKTKITIITIDLYRNTAISCFIFTGAILINKINIYSVCSALEIFLYQIWFKPTLTLNYINKFNVLMVSFYPHNNCIQIRKKFSFSLVRYYSTVKPLHPWWVTGFIDGEGCFHISVTQNKDFKLGWRVQLLFEIHLNEKDLALLIQIKNYFGVGSISYNKKGKSYVFKVSSPKDLKIIIAHFNKFKLITKKRADFNLIIMVNDILKRKEHLTQEGLIKILAIKASMNRGLPEKLKLAFPDVVPVERPKLETPKTIDQQWLAGFTDAEGCFLITIFKSKTKQGEAVKLVLVISQHARDEKLMIRIKEFLNCGNVYSNRIWIDYRVTKFKDIEEKIIPFFSKNKIRGVKALNFDDWCRVAELMSSKKHLTRDGLDQILKIKNVMNTNRK